MTPIFLYIYVNFVINFQYWRANESDINLHYCSINPDSCLGYDKCEEGYQGMLCEACDFENNYKKNSKNQCE